MLGDVLLITDNHEKVAKEIVEKLGDPTKLNKFTLAIGGESGSGKSEVSHMISKTLKNMGVYAKIIHTDNYYKIHPKQRAAWRKEKGIDSIGITELDWELVNKHILDFKEDKKCSMPCIDLLTDQVDNLTTDFRGIQVLILDGLYCLSAEVNLKIMIDLSYHETKKAQLIRGKEKLNEERLKVLEREHQVVQSLKPKAHLLITKDFEVISAN
ncbi:MAG: zeta toxin family protein [Candidatus Thorarchaeota archaeon]